MAEPDWNPDTAGRPLAEILREAGIESAARAGRRRRWDDPEETSLRQRRAEAAADTEARSTFGRRASDLADGQDSRRPSPGPSTAAIPGLRPSRTPEVPTPAPPVVMPPQRARRAPDRRPSEWDWSTPEQDGRAHVEPDRALGRQQAARPEWGPADQDWGPADDQDWGTADRRGRSADRDQRQAGRDRRSGDRDQRPGGRDRPTTDRPARPPAGQDFSTGPIPIVRDDAVVTDEDSSPRESALAWARFAGELVIALIAGVGVYFLATVLWQQVPRLAVLLTPLAVTGLVAGVSVWRQRMGREPVGTRLLAVLVFAGALLTVAPAAGLIPG
jgi:hypothetical protein